MNSRITATDLFLGVLALLLVGVSFWQTWLGLGQIFGNASLPVGLSAIVGYVVFNLENQSKEETG